MTIFDLLFLALVVISLGAWLFVIAAAVRGQKARALRIARNLAIAAAAYLAIVLIVAVRAPQRVLQVGDPWCFDDWCLRVDHVSRTAGPSQATYTVSLNVFSRALRVSQRAKGAWVYLMDARGNRYAPEPDRGAVPLDVRLEPGESIETSRVFRVPADAGPMGLITGHGPAWLPAFIIGDEGSPFHKPTFVRLE